MLPFMYVIATCVVVVMGAPSPDDDGKWHPNEYGDTGRYMRPPNEGKYIHIPNPYRHIHNPYLHDGRPYDGGYGRYGADGLELPEYDGAETQNEIYKYVLTDNEDLPYYKPGYYYNNGIKILDQKHNYKPDSYDFKFETENKIRANEKAVIENANTIDEAISSEGFYEYIGPDGFLYRVEYTAGKEGFRPKIKRLETKYSGKWVLEKVN